MDKYNKGEMEANGRKVGSESAEKGDRGGHEQSSPMDTTENESWGRQTAVTDQNSKGTLLPQEVPLNHQDLDLNIPPPDQTMIVYPANGPSEAVDTYTVTMGDAHTEKGRRRWWLRNRVLRSDKDERKGVCADQETMLGQSRCNKNDAPRITYLPDEP